MMFIFFVKLWCCSNFANGSMSYMKVFDFLAKNSRGNIMALALYDGKKVKLLIVGLVAKPFSVIQK